MQDEFPNTTIPTRGTSAQANEVVTVVALFETLPEAENAVDDLTAEGFDRSRVNVVTSNAAGDLDGYAAEDDALDADSTGSGEGAAGSIVGGLVNAGVDEERAGSYAEGVRRGGTLITVETTAARTATAEDIMVRNGSVDIKERVEH